MIDLERDVEKAQEALTLAISRLEARRLSEKIREQFAMQWGPLVEVVKRGPGRPRKASPPGPFSVPVVYRAKVRKPLSAARKRSAKIQGKYLGALRRLKGAERAKVKAIARRDGVGAALGAIAKMT